MFIFKRKKEGSFFKHKKETKEESTPQEKAINYLKESEISNKEKEHKVFCREMIELVKLGKFNVSKKETFNQTPLKFFEKQLGIFKNMHKGLVEDKKNYDFDRVQYYNKKIEELEKILEYMKKEENE